MESNPRNLSVEWGARLRAARLERDLSQMAVASKAGIDKSWYARIEAGSVGSRGVGDDVRMNIAAALGMRVEEIWVYPTAHEAAEVAG